jgi:hypothetical protein
MVLTNDQESELTRLAQRAQIVLLAAQRLQNKKTLPSGLVLGACR